jgi:putative transposase
MTIDNELIDDLLKDCKKPEDLIGENGLLKQLTKRLLERAMAAELTEHVGYEKHDPVGNNSGNSRNGKSAKTLKGSFGRMPIEVPVLNQVNLPTTVYTKYLTPPLVVREANSCQYRER